MFNSKFPILVRGKALITGLSRMRIGNLELNIGQISLALHIGIYIVHCSWTT